MYMWHYFSLASSLTICASSLVFIIIIITIIIIVIIIIIIILFLHWHAGWDMDQNGDNTGVLTWQPAGYQTFQTAG